MIKTISRLDRLAALRRVFRDRGMLKGRLSQYALAIVTGTSPQILPYGVNNSENSGENGSRGHDGDDDGGPLPGSKTLASEKQDQPRFASASTIFEEKT